MKIDLSKAIEQLKLGEVVGIPTETVYGLAAQIHNEAAIKKIFKTKERPFFDPLIVHVASIEQAQSLTTDWSKVAAVLALNFWPGPLTMVLKKTKDVSDLITSGLQTVGLRMPKHPLTLELLTRVGPLAAPSANKFGKTSPTTAAHVESEFKKENVLVIDGGPCDVGIESTILLIEAGQRHDFQLSILRPGMISQAEIETVLKKSGFDYHFFVQIQKHLAPGQMEHHYMPEKPLILVSQVSRKVFEQDRDQFTKAILKKVQELPEVVECIKIKKITAIHQFSELQLNKNPTLAARELYAQLRSCSESDCDAILFFETLDMESDQWGPIKERIEKAATLSV